MWHGIHNTFPRLSKYSLGEKIDALFVAMLENLFLARYSDNASKFLHLQTAGAKLDLLKFFLQVSWEIKVLDHKQFASISEPLHAIGKMVGGWQKQLKT